MADMAERTQDVEGLVERVERWLVERFPYSKHPKAAAETLLEDTGIRAEMESAGFLRHRAETAEAQLESLREHYRAQSAEWEKLTGHAVPGHARSEMERREVALGEINLKAQYIICRCEEALHDEHGFVENVEEVAREIEAEIEALATGGDDG